MIISKFWEVSTEKVNKFIRFNNETFINFYIKSYNSAGREFKDTARNI
ncbi:hypothetical protein LQE93_15410 [Clostridium sp. NSJ-145]|nr:hypothetical protein [Clostridium sp. NSJ-145]MCD2503148.1 hypothetical protein [Clostridium sp. NSJ-145]MDY3360380.1 hypothetical protein [Clostridium celatum]